MRRNAVIFGSTFTIMATAGGLIYFNGGQKQLGFTAHGLVRFSRTALTVLRISYDYKKSLWNVDQSSSQYKELISQVHTRSAIRLRDLCFHNAGLYIKIGQHLGSLNYLLPSEYVETLRIFHHNAPESSLPDVYHVFKKELGKDPAEVFESFDPKPLGSASLAQVHKAVMKNGEIAAVKIQHRNIQEYSSSDVKAMEVPKVYWDYSSKRILTMEYCEGGHVNDLKYMKDHKISSDEVSSKVGRIYSEMIFVQGCIHCDPHPGNILIRKNNRGTVEIVLLDHGLYHETTSDFRVNYSKLWQAIIAADLNGIKECSEKMGVGDTYGIFACMLSARTWETVMNGMEKTPPSQQEMQELRQSVSLYLSDISSILNRVPRQLLLILKTNDLLRSIDHQLQTSKASQSFVTMSKCCAEAVAREELRVCENWVDRFKVYCSWSLVNMRIFLYQATASISLETCSSVLANIVGISTIYLLMGIS